MITNFIITFVVAFGVAFAVTPIVRIISLQMGWLDKPNWRKIQRKPMPLLGGAAIFAGFILAILLVRLRGPIFGDLYRFWGVVICSFLIVLVGIQDDIRGLSARRKLFYQIAIAMTAYVFGFSIITISHPLGGSVQAPVWVSMFFTIFWIVGFINAVNLLDGMDGLAAGVVAIISASLFFFGVRGGNYAVAILALALGASALGFLPHNFHPAKIFMGDTGSMLLGFILAIISIEGAYKAQTFVTMVVPLVAMALPFIDTGLSIIRRLIRKKKIFEADKEHVHHKLMGQGGSQKEAVMTLYFLTLCFGLIAVGLSRMRGYWALGAIVITALLTIRWALNFRLLDFIVKKDDSKDPERP
jgi:UDP-GlcNAc:undecaprenyl-phosphate GlcNAc-1-phosphate transferase